MGLTESDTPSPGPGEVQVDGCPSENCDFHVSDERGAATIMTAHGPREQSRMGGSCPVNEHHASVETCVEMSGSCHQWRGLVGELVTPTDLRRDIPLSRKHPEMFVRAGLDLHPSTCVRAEKRR